MQSISTIGLDIAKSVFQVHGVDAAGQVVIRYAKTHGTRHRPWLTGLLARRPTKVAAIALANKLARMAWAMMHHQNSP
jgi:transposase